MNLFSLLGVTKDEVAKITAKRLRAMREILTKSNKGYVSHSRVDQDTCPHSEWAPEAKENNWRSFCLKCGMKAQGSCQS